MVSLLLDRKANLTETCFALRSPLKTDHIRFDMGVSLLLWKDCSR